MVEPPEREEIMIAIGLTGGMGSGKSAIARILASLGAAVVDADKVGHEVYRAGTPAFCDVVHTFGDNIVGNDGEIDRRKLGSIVFNDREKLSALTGIVWPRQREALRAKIEDQRARGTATATVVEAAILFEAGWDELFDEVWAVVAPVERVLDRLQARNGISEGEARARLRAQMSPEERVGRADVVIENEGTLQSLERRVVEVWNARVPRGTYRGKHSE